MHAFLSVDKQTQELNLKQFEIRKTAKLLICILCFLQFLYRIAAIIWDSSLTQQSILMVEISLPLCASMIIVICLEYFLFKKIGPKMAKYSNFLDILLLLIFMSDWLIYLKSSLYKIQHTDPPSFKVSALFGFTSFSWRTLLVMLLVQKWQLKIIPPLCATLLVAGHAFYYTPGNLTFLLLRAALQLFSIILIVYCEDKVKWKLMQTNLEQEKWMQMNSFILDSIPENIIILDFNGEARFMTEYCKIFLKKDSSSLDEKEFFKKVRDLQQLQYESDLLGMERHMTYNEVTTGPNEESEQNILRVESLEALVANFPKLIKSKNLRERQFLVYNGKFKAGESHHQPERSIEMKISYVQHYKTDYIILIFRDTTQRDLLVKLEETNNYKDQLLASVSHELRAPLNGNINLIEGAVSLSEISENIKETLLIPALRTSKFLLHIINDILDMSQIKEKKFRLVFQSEDLKETLKNAAQLVEIQAQKKGLELSLEIHPEFPRNFCTDHLRVSQIVLNLLTNAVKFTNKGRVKLIATSFNNNKTSAVQISVEDTGIGMSQENIKKLFSKMNPIIDGEERERMNPHGVGLGLNIASNLVQLLAPQGHQKINVISAPNEGSTFTFVLENKALLQSIDFDRLESNNLYEVAEEFNLIAQPRMLNKMQVRASSPCSPYYKIEPLINSCSCPKVLIVDDNPFNTMALETILRSLQIKYHSVFNGASALEALLSRQKKTCDDKDCKNYSVVFMDQEMPGMSGTETVREIRKLQEGNQVSSEIRLIGCTAHKGKEEVDRFLASGLENCIFKPISIAIVKDVLKEFRVK